MSVTTCDPQPRFSWARPIASAELWVPKAGEGEEGVGPWCECLGHPADRRALIKAFELAAEQRGSASRCRKEEGRGVVGGYSRSRCSFGGGGEAAAGAKNVAASRPRKNRTPKGPCGPLQEALVCGLSDCMSTMVWVSGLTPAQDAGQDHGISAAHAADARGHPAAAAEAGKGAVGRGVGGASRQRGGRFRKAGGPLSFSATRTASTSGVPPIGVDPCWPPRGCFLTTAAGRSRQTPFSTRSSSQECAPARSRGALAAGEAAITGPPKARNGTESQAAKDFKKPKRQFPPPGKLIPPLRRRARSVGRPTLEGHPPALRSGGMRVPLADRERGALWILGRTLKDHTKRLTGRIILGMEPFSMLSSGDSRASTEGSGPNCTDFFLEPGGSQLLNCLRQLRAKGTFVLIELPYEKSDASIRCARCRRDTTAPHTRLDCAQRSLQLKTLFEAEFCGFGVVGKADTECVRGDFSALRVARVLYLWLIWGRGGRWWEGVLVEQRAAVSEGQLIIETSAGLDAFLGTSVVGRRSICLPPELVKTYSAQWQLRGSSHHHQGEGILAGRTTPGGITAVLDSDFPCDLLFALRDGRREQSIKGLQRIIHAINAVQS
ncbi:hypothetical protein cyc_03671 [Cyclospora cayetanensis]|uniref:Uncharacterized protein n=1 Tax=Cyclospora cayetanensis TaxID=88456 RepID=A0A1D3D9X8_9EIME|nr:hypothetical protein cyc_03671 [Cyclospora cayetanensis]